MRDRNEAAAHVLTLLRGWAPAYVRRAAPCPLDEDDIEEAIQHLLAQSATGSSRFRQRTEGEAHAWCMRVLLNKSRDLCRLRRSLDRQGETEDADSERGSRQIPVAPDHEDLAVRELIGILEAIEGELMYLHREKDVPTVARSLRCYVESRLGASIDEQVAALGDELGTSSGLVRARNRIYQHRARGRAAGCEALRSLVARGRFTAEDVEPARRFLGCEGATVEADCRSVS